MLNYIHLVALVSANQDPFWLAQVKKIKEDSLSMTYYHHGPQISGKRLVWKAHNSRGTCGKFDVYFRFKTEEQIFTKSKTILKQALKKIAQACLIYNGLEVPETFKKKAVLLFGLHVHSLTTRDRWRGGQGMIVGIA
jgi:hypothetical protein